MEDESASAPKKIKTERYKCAACYKLYNKKEHLVEHMKVSYHSVHEPSCGVCKKHCRSFESPREHLIGPLPKSSCAEFFVTQGCNLCMNIFDSSDALSAHKEICCLSPTIRLGPTTIPLIESKVEFSNLSEAIQVPEAIAIDCEMVCGGYDGTLDICASVCLIDESENVLFHTYVKPILPVTNYRYDITGLTEEHLKDAMPLEEVEEKILKILRNGETISRLSLEGGKGRLLVGHSLKNDLECLRICYPDHMLRDTAMYRPLMKTNFASHSLKYLTKTYLGYEIQSGIHDPFEDCVAAMRLYKRMHAQDHPMEKFTTPIVSHKSSRCSTMFDSTNSKELEEMSPEDLLKMSKSNYRCWCLDSTSKLSKSKLSELTPSSFMDIYENVDVHHSSKVGKM